MRIEAAIFDCDGVLVDSEALGLDASRAYLAGHGFTWSADDLVRLFTGLRDDVFSARLEAEHLRLHGRPAPDGFFQGLVEARRSLAHLLQPVAGARAAAEAAPRRAVASSSRAGVLEKKLKRTDLWGAFAPHVYSADLVAHGKPAPDIFLYAAARLEAAPGACVAIEDSPAGVAAAHAAGMTVWGFTGGGHCGPEQGARLTAAGASAVYPDMARLADALHAGFAG